MVSVSGSDHILRLIRHELERMERKTSSRSASKAASSSHPKAPPERLSLEALSELSDLDERQFKRLAINTILASEFGEQATSGPAFTAIAERVQEAIDADPELSKLYAEFRNSLKAAP